MKVKLRKRETFTGKVIRHAYAKGYRVYNGHFFNPRGERIFPRSYSRNKKGRPTINIGLPKEFFGGKSQPIPAHRFAAYCYYGETIFLMYLQVRHLNHNKWDFRRSNLKLGTFEQNARDHKAGNSREVGFKHSMLAADHKKLSSFKLRELLREMYFQNAYSCARIARVKNLDGTAVRCLIRGQTFRCDVGRSKFLRNNFSTKIH